MGPLPRCQCPTTDTTTRRLRGPSNSQKRIDCHVPRGILPSIVGTISEQPIIDDLTCAAVGPPIVCSLASTACSPVAVIAAAYAAGRSRRSEA